MNIRISVELKKELDELERLAGVVARVCFAFEEEGIPTARLYPYRVLRQKSGKEFNLLPDSEGLPFPEVVLSGESYKRFCAYAVNETKRLLGQTN
ncbi:MAG TPA: hypothetical protein VEI54_00690 [Candidatus Limnocylindrales bacterium]|nr:hypothetical protein [Candidatus Limnocylindrales bacterium]